ncbi:MAG: class I SAM-dependent methyltransferase [Chloroflexota bacterium]|nr:MAG: class I SAM-dependent methyltransferase [Chloroflexota bacterium]
MNLLETAIQRAIDTRSQIYNKKQNCPDNRRDAELRYLYHLAERAPDGAAAELGVRTGGSFLCWSMARAGRGLLYAVDDWSSKTRDVFLDNVRKYAVPVEVITAKSWEAAAVIETDFAFVFVDASHDIGIWRDIPAWTPKIMTGGIIAFHDYGVWKPTVKVKEAVDAWQAEAHWQHLGQVGSTIAFRRIGL